jgi:Zn-dependent peptidase ImmA (M78 family)
VTLCLWQLRGVGRHFVIRVRQADTRGRQRFSRAHGIIHIFFMEAGGRLPAGSAVLDSWSPQEEDLCDQGAAELLLPRAAFIAACPPHPDMDDVLSLARAFDASAEATALRVVTLSAIPAAVIVLEPSLKPAELTRIAPPSAARHTGRLPRDGPNRSPPARPKESRQPTPIHTKA